MVSDTMKKTITVSILCLVEYIKCRQDGILGPASIKQLIIGTILAGIFLITIATDLCYNQFVIFGIYALAMGLSKLWDKIPTPPSTIFYKTVILENAEECSICLDNVLNAVQCRQCRHNFHENCLTEWLKDSNVCPHCRQD